MGASRVRIPPSPYRKPCSVTELSAASAGQVRDSRGRWPRATPRSTTWPPPRPRSRGRQAPSSFPHADQAETERAGFEPATHLSARTRFPVALLRPLGHLSVLRSGEGGIRTLDGGIHPHNALAGRRLQPLGHFSADDQDTPASAGRNSLFGGRRAGG